MAEELGEFAGFLVFEALVHDHQWRGVLLVRAAGILDDDKVGAVVVDKQLPRESLPHECLAERRAVKARGVAAGEGALHVAGKCEVVGQFRLERADDVCGRAIDAASGGFGEVSVDLALGG